MARQQGQGQQQTGDELGGDVAREGVVPGGQLSPYKQVIALGPDGHAVARQLRQQRLQRTPWQAASALKNSFCAQNPHQGQQEAQSGAALAAGQEDFSRRRGGEGDEGEAVTLYAFHLRAQGFQAGEGGKEVA